MAKPKRQRIEPPHQWEQLELRFTSPEQRTYELIRPVVLFGVPPQERAKETGAPERTLYRHVQRFAQHGMRSLFATELSAPPLRVPETIRETVAALKAEAPHAQADALPRGLPAPVLVSRYMLPGAPARQRQYLFHYDLGKL